jgi:hypothetical protein
VIVTEDFGYTLRCSGCKAYITLSMNELRDMDRMLDIKSEMKKAHSDCDSFKDVAKARAAIEQERRAARRLREIKR